MNKHLDSYLAGVFDGEGYISAQFTRRYTSNGRQSTRLLIGVGMKYRPIPELFQKRFGGSLKTYQARSSVMHHWYVCGRNSIEALRLISAMCLEKAKQADFALELAIELSKQKVRGKRPQGSQILSDEQIDRREELCNIITRLKHQ